MLFWLAVAAASAAAVPPSSPEHPARHFSPAAAEAVATVRIVSGVRVKLGPGQGKQDQSGDVPCPHDSMIVADGTARPAKLIEFE